MLLVCVMINPPLHHHSFWFEKVVRSKVALLSGEPQDSSTNHRLAVIDNDVRDIAS